MNRFLKFACFCLVSAPAVVAAQAASNVIYKFVDEHGKVTYANSPIRGGARIDLEPLTVIPSTPSGSLSSINAQRQAPARTANEQNSQAAAQPAAVAPSETKVALATQADSRSFNADAVQQLTEQRRAETRKRILESEVQNEEDMLAGARAKLSEEQRGSGNYRAMRTSFAASPEAVTPHRPLINPDTRAEIERHFERIRNLQDQVAMHENHLRELRDQLARLK